MPVHLDQADTPPDTKPPESSVQDTKENANTQPPTTPGKTTLQTKHKALQFSKHEPQNARTCSIAGKLIPVTTVVKGGHRKRKQTLRMIHKWKAR